MGEVLDFLRRLHEFRRKYGLPTKKYVRKPKPKPLKEVRVEFNEKGEPITISIMHWDNLKEFIQKLSALK